MVIYTKYSNERRREFCIRTDIVVDEQGEKSVHKLAAFPEAAEHIRSIQKKYQWLCEDFSGTKLKVNVCETEEMQKEATAAVRFPFLTGQTLEEALDELLKVKNVDAILEEIRRYFAMFADANQVFEETEAFRAVFGHVEFTREQSCRRISDIDMVFANALRTEDGYALIDYEWTFDFPVPVRFLQYRCLYYYILGNTKRDVLTHHDIYGLFDISKEEQKQFAEMERRFQAYILGEYIPVWKLYDDISDGVIPVLPLVEKASSMQRTMRAVEVYFDDGRGFGVWNWKRYQVEPESRVKLRIELPEGTRAVRIDPCETRSVVRIEHLSQGGMPLTATSNGETAPNGDYIFDTKDPQLVISSLPRGLEPVEITFRTGAMTGLTREVILNQNGRIRWMEQTKVWKTYQKLKHGKK